MLDLSQLTQILEAIYYAVIVLGVPVGLYQYMQAKRREREDWERQVFDDVSASYIAFQQLCLERPYLDIFDVADEHPAKLTPAQAKEEQIAFSILLAIFERAYLLYAERRTPITSAQGREWDLHVRGYFQRPNFRHAWHRGTSSYDPRFVAYMDEIERQLLAPVPRPSPPLLISDAERMT